MSEPVKRRYDNTGRQRRADLTRRAILEAARQAFVERGYRGATMSSIARAAGVSVDTVYETTGRKPVLLRELIELAISGDDRPAPAEERDYVRQIRAEPDPVAKIARFAAATRAIQERLAPLLQALRDAAGTEADAVAVWAEISARRAANMHRFVEDLRDAGGLRPGLSPEVAADTVWVTNSSEVFLLLTRDQGWSTEQYEAWLIDVWVRVLLP